MQQFNWLYNGDEYSRKHNIVILPLEIPINISKNLLYLEKNNFNYIYGYWGAFLNFISFEVLIETFASNYVDIFI